MTSPVRQPPRHHTVAWSHQADAYWFACGRKASLLDMDMGTGKSKVAIDLLLNWDAARVLVLCPKSVLGVWRRELARHAPDEYAVLILDRGTVAAKAKEARRFLAMHRRAVVVINYESAWRSAFAEFALAEIWDVVIADESHRLKSPSASVSKFAAKLAKCARRRLALTGTPMPHSPLDAFGQFRFLDPEVFGKSWWTFSHRYAVRGNPYIPQQVTGFANLEELREKVRANAFRVRACDVLSLPEVLHDTRTFQLSPPAAQIYRDLQSEFIAEVNGGVCTVANALVKILRLQQITSGYLPVVSLEDEREFIQQVDGSRQQVLADLLEDIGPREPVVVFCLFRHDLARIQETADGLGLRYGELSGQRRDLTPHSEMPEGIDVMGVQLQSGGVGIDLTRARYGIYYGIGHSLGVYEQSLARIHRPGQTRPVVYYHILAEGTVDETIYAALRRKKEVVEFVLQSLVSKEVSCAN